MKNTFILFIAIVLASCTSSKQKDASPQLLDAKNFQEQVNGKSVDLFTLKNKEGVSVQLTNYGARIVSIFTPDRMGQFADITFGYNSIHEYLNDNMYLGCTVGRYANRISGGKFSIDGKPYSLTQNDGNNSLHGGPEGFQTRVWDAVQTGNKVTFTYVSAHMQEGYPGAMTVSVAYELNDKNELVLDYMASTDQPTVVNLTNHAFFNLRGEGDETILDHTLQIFADNITPVDSTLIPTGDIVSIKGTALDFTEPKIIGDDIYEADEQLKYGLGYDHNWVLNNTNSELTLAARLSEETTGRIVEFYTTEPAIQFYSGNFMDGTVTGKSGKKYQFRSGLALEPQHFPNSPNQSNFPNTRLNPGETYTQTSVFKFAVRE